MPDRDRPLVWLHGKIKTPPMSSAARIEAGVLLRRCRMANGLRSRIPARCQVSEHHCDRRVQAAAQGLRRAWLAQEVSMKQSKRKKLEAAGWRVGSVDEFLGLSAVESILVDLR